jgi:hypothetical protein
MDVDAYKPIQEILPEIYKLFHINPNCVIRLIMNGKIIPENVSLAQANIKSYHIIKVHALLPT